MKLNFSRSALFHTSTKVCLIYFGQDCSFSSGLHLEFKVVFYHLSEFTNLATVLHWLQRCSILVGLIFIYIWMTIFSLQLQDVSHTSPDHLIQPVTSNEDIIVLNNPSLAEKDQSSARVKLQWRNLCVDADLPPSSCFKRCWEKNIGSRTKPILKNGISQYINSKIQHCRSVLEKSFFLNNRKN